MWKNHLILMVVWCFSEWRVWLPLGTTNGNKLFSNYGRCAYEVSVEDTVKPGVNRNLL